MIDDEIRRTEGVDGQRIPAEAFDRVSDGGEIDDCRNPGEVLQQDSGWLEGDFHIVPAIHLPVENPLNVFGLHLKVVTVAHGRLQKHAHGERKLLCERDETS